MSNVSKIREIKENKLHFGNTIRRWNPYMESFIYKKSEKIYILSWKKIINSLRKVNDYIRKILVDEKRTILFLSTSKEAKDIMKEKALECNMPFLINKWKGGFLTNFSIIRKKIKELKKLILMTQSKEFDNYNKKEQILLKKKKEKLFKIYEGVINFEQSPELLALFIVGLEKEKNALKEAKIMKIPVIAICNTNCDPRFIDYIIPGNDRKKKSINFLVNVVSDNIKKVNDEIKHLQNT